MPLLREAKTLKLRRRIAILMFAPAVLSGSLWAQGTGQGGTSEIEATGTGAILAGDVALARDRAIDDALRKAVEQALGTYLKSETIVQNFQVVDDNILAWSEGYVRNYQVVSEYKADENTYKVTLRASVEMSNLQKDAEAVQSLIAKMGNPRLMILINEQNIGESYDRYAYFSVDMTSAETVMLDEFNKQGFECVDPATAKENTARESILAALEGDAKAAAAIAVRQGAEVIITGKAFAKVASGINLGGMKSCQANFTGRAIKADVATILATTSQHAAVPHIDEITGGTMAIEKASRLAATDLISKILAKWKEEFYKATTVKLQVLGIQTFSQASDFSSTVKYYIRGIKSVNQRNVAGGAAEYDVKITGNADQLARELERKDFEKFNVKVTAVTPNKITLRLLAKSAPAKERLESAPQDTVGM